jgi:hypothetical protein
MLAGLELVSLYLFYELIVDLLSFAKLLVQVLDEFDVGLYDTVSPL